MLDESKDDEEKYSHPSSTLRKIGHHKPPRRPARSIQGIDIVADN